MKKIILCAFCILVCLSHLCAFSEDAPIFIQQQISQMNAHISVYARYGNNEIRFNADEKMPLFSVYKVCIAYSFLKKLEKNGNDVSTLIKVKYSGLDLQTYSPLLDKFNQDFEITAGELVKYAVALSDNNASDIMMKYAGGASKIKSDLQKNGLKNINIAYNEKQMHAKFVRCYKNCSSTKSICDFYDKLQKGQLLSPEMTNFLINVLYETSTGADKIKAGLGDVAFAHKTGSGFRTPEGKMLGNNDSGFFTLPNGQTCFIAIFIRDSFESNEKDADFMAKVAKIILESAN